MFNLLRRERRDAARVIFKLRPQQGALAKEELLVELTLGDNVHVGSLLPLGSYIAFHFIVAINMATSGFWWWPLAPNRERFYEKIQDLENKDKGVELDDPSFNIFTQRRELTDVHMQNLTLCLAALPGPNDQHRAPAYTFYLGGLNFMALNSVQWRCEGQAFGNFLESLRLLMVEAKNINDARGCRGLSWQGTNRMFAKHEHAADGTSKVRSMRAR